ncbi:MAG: peptidylprolyl isomerase [Clostridia bacterium]|nr:peptidylprolyl isomerase [Clostridia bacterium]
MSIMKKLLSAALALMLIAMSFALAEDDVAAQLEAANARIAELEAQIELYKPFYDAQVVIEYDGGIVSLTDVLDVYAQYESMYAQYGIDPVAYGLDGTLKQQAADSLLEEAIKADKAAQLGLDELSEETMEALRAEAAETFESYVTSIADQMEEGGSTNEEVRQQAIDYLIGLGYSEEGLLDDMVSNEVDDQLYTAITADVEVTEEDIQAAYDELLESQQTSFASDREYNSARSNGDLIVYNPAGYRAVKHVLVQFDDEQTSRMDEINARIADLQAELDALNAPEEVEAVEAVDEVEAVEAVDALEAVEAVEEEEEPRTEEDITADLESAQAELDALYAELLPVAQEVIDKYNAGEDFAALIDEYNSDPGMENEPTATEGYAVSFDSTTWDVGFRDGAMGIANVGEISEPVKSAYGFHIIRYESDIPKGAVALDEVRDAIAETALESKISDTYNSTIDQWIEEANPVYHYDRIG